MKHLLNCTNCAWWTVVESDSFIQVDCKRDQHEEGYRNALSVGPYCPRRSVVITRLREEAEVGVNLQRRQESRDS